MGKIIQVILGLYLWVLLCSCSDGSEKSEALAYKTQNVIIVVTDGPRYSETWGDPSHRLIPRMAEISSSGIINTEFYNNGPTYTNAGHTAITTGVYQEINNAGNELPDYPSIFQYWLKEPGNNNSKAWIITSKDKLEVLSDTKNFLWNNMYRPATNCGINGSGTGSGYRNDTLTQKAVLEILKMDHPSLVLINYREPDFSAHQNNWTAYQTGIRSTDQFIYEIWNLIKTDPIYANTTTLFVTNDHGRHLDGIADGFVSHGDTCSGCRHISFFAFGPDFKAGIVTEIPREQIDISATVARLLNFTMSSGNGAVMEELFLQVATN